MNNDAISELDTNEFEHISPSANRVFECIFILYPKIIIILICVCVQDKYSRIDCSFVSAFDNTIPILMLCDVLQGNIFLLHNLNQIVL